MRPSRFKLPKINSLYGRIFAIFWFTMFLVLMAVLSLPHLDPRKARDIPQDHYQRMIEIRDGIEKKYRKRDNLGKILFSIEGQRRSKHDPRPRIFFSDHEGNVLTTSSGHRDFKLRALQNFVTSIEDQSQPKQKLYGRYMIAGPVPINIANSDLLMYVGFKWNEPHRSCCVCSTTHCNCSLPSCW